MCALRVTRHIYIYIWVVCRICIASKVAIAQCGLCVCICTPSLRITKMFTICFSYYLILALPYCWFNAFSVSFLLFSFSRIAIEMHLLRECTMFGMMLRWVLHFYSHVDHKVKMNEKNRHKLIMGKQRGTKKKIDWHAVLPGFCDRVHVQFFIGLLIQRWYTEKNKKKMMNSYRSHHS